MPVKFKEIKEVNNNGQPINGKVPFAIWDDFQDLLTIERRKTDRKLTQWNFLLLIIREGMRNWIK